MGQPAARLTPVVALDRFFEHYYRARPVQATFTGMHEYDHLLPDWSPEGLEATVSEMHTLRTILGGAPFDRRSPWPKPHARRERRPAVRHCVPRRGRPDARRCVPRNPNRRARERPLHSSEPGAVDGRSDFRPHRARHAAVRPDRHSTRRRDRAHAGHSRLSRDGNAASCRRLPRRGVPVHCASARRPSRSSATACRDGGGPSGAAGPDDRRGRRSGGGGQRRIRTLSARGCNERCLKRLTSASRAGTDLLALLLRRGHWCTTATQTLVQEARRRTEAERSTLDRQARKYGGWREAQEQIANAHPPREDYLPRFARVWEACRDAAVAHRLVTWPEAPHPLRADSRTHTPRGAASVLPVLPLAGTVRSTPGSRLRRHAD